MSAHVLKVGIREFRAHLQQYLLTSSIPVAVTRHGETVGFYIPARHHAEKSEIDSLKRAAVRFEKLLASHKLTEDELLADFRVLREGKRKKR
jgi:hypothetical protein